MKDPDGAWLAMVLNPETPALLDTAGLNNDLKELSAVKNHTIMSLDQLLTELETSGETKLSLTGRSLVRANMTHKIEQSGYIVFKLDNKAPLCGSVVGSPWQSSTCRLACVHVYAIMLHMHVESWCSFWPAIGETINVYIYIYTYIYIYKHVYIMYIYKDLGIIK